MNRRKTIYRRILIAALAVNILMIGVFSFLFVKNRIPSDLKILVHESERIDLSLNGISGEIYPEPEGGGEIGVLSVNNKKLSKDVIHLDLKDPFSLKAEKTGNYKINVKLFGLINLKEVNLDVIEDARLIPGGFPIGINVESDGVMVLGTGTITGMDGLNYEPALNILKSGDYILKAGNAPVETKEELMSQISSCGGEKLPLTIKRNGEITEVVIAPIETPDHDYKIGVWIRDDAQGIGTLTYVDEEGRFGALGHGITDIDTGELMNIRDGAIYKASILDIVKGKSGEPGEIVGMIQKQKNALLGSVAKNTGQGIFGTYQGELLAASRQKALPIGLKQGVKAGPATILCQIGNQVEERGIEIEKIEWNTQNPSKGMVLHITDKELLKQTNGIIQGMSGSPIIQDGKLIGAVTHVFVQDSTRGYGIFIENMLKAAE